MVNLHKLRRIHHSPINPDLLFLPSLDIKEKPQTTCKQKQGLNNLLRKSATWSAFHKDITIIPQQQS